MSKVTGIYYENNADVLRIEKENQEGKSFYDYFPIASFTDVKQLEIMANKLYKLQF